MIYRFQAHEQIYEIQLERQGDGYLAKCSGQSYHVEILDHQSGQLSLRIQGKPTRLYWAAEQDKKWISLDGCTYLIEKPAQPANAHKAADRAKEGRVASPMPAQIRSIEVQTGDQVEKGQTLLLLEAMKMEIRITAPITGRIVYLNVKQNDLTRRDDLLLVIE